MKFGHVMLRSHCRIQLQDAGKRVQGLIKQLIIRYVSVKALLDTSLQLFEELIHLIKTTDF